jgi:dTDP-4-amino-4,6-dideoxygalactose transaminase
VSIPVLDLQAQYSAIKPEIDAAIAGVIERTEFVLGPSVKQLESSVAEFCECDFGVGVASGTDALLLALMAAGVRPGDEVVTTSFSFIATANTISRCGATPVFVDVEPDTLNLDQDQVSDRITERTKAIVPVHLFGHPADIGRLMEIADARGIVVIEDAAQAIGARYRGRRVASFGRAGCLSFYPTKNLGAYGDGGMVVTNDATMAEQVDILRRHGSKTKYHADVLGMNSRLDAIQAALLSAKLAHLDEWNDMRRRVAIRYGELLADLPVELPVEKPYAQHVYHQYTIQTDRRDELAAFLKDRAIGTMIYYPVPLHKQRLYMDHASESYPVAERASSRVLSLPIYPELTEDQTQTVATAIRDFFGR